MVIGRRSLHRAWILAGFLAACSLAAAQESASDQAKRLLKEGTSQYGGLDFKAAQATFLKAGELLKDNASALSEAEKKELDDYLAKVPNALRQQAAAMEAYRGAETALAGGKLDEAIAGFGQAATSDFVNDATRKDAQAQLALAQKRKEAAALAAAAKETPPAPATPPAPPPTPPPTPPAPPVTPAAEPKGPAAGTTAIVPPTPVTPASPTPTGTVPAPEIPATPVVTPPTPAVAPAPVAPAAPAPAGSKLIDDLAERKAKARQLLALGKKALDDKNADEAVRCFQRAKDLDPDLVEAGQLLESTGTLASLRTPSDAGILSRLERRNLIAKQAATVDINRSLDRAVEALSAAAKGTDFDTAEQAARQALDTLQANKSFYGDMEYRNLQARIDSQLQLIAMKREAFNKAKAGEEAAEIERIKEQRRLEEQRMKAQKVATLTEQARALRSRKQYDKELEVLSQILLIDEENSWANREKEVVTEFDLLLRDDLAFRNFRTEESKNLADLRETEVPWWQYLRYPRNWKQLTEMRKEVQASAAGESAADAALREKLNREIERLSFVDIDFNDVVSFLKEYSDANIHVNWRALQAAGIEKTTKVSVDVRKISVKRALDLVLRDVSGAAAGADAELRYVIDGGVLTISTKADLAREPIRRVYDIRDLLVPVPDFYGPRIEMTEAAQQSSSSTTGSSSTAGIFEEESRRREKEEEEITKEKLTEDFINLVKNAIDRDSWGDAQTGGTGMGFIQVLNGQLVVTQTAENHQALAELIEKLREAKTIQIMIEARFVTVDTGFLNSVGVDLDFYFNLGSQQQRANGPVITDPFTGARVPTFVDSTGQVISSFPVFAAGPWPGTATGGSTKWSPIGAKQGSAGFISGIQTLTGSNIGLDVSDNGPAVSVGGTFLDDIQVDFLVQATQAHASTRQLTAPKITLSNSQRAYITVARQQAYIREYIPVVSGNATAYRPVIDYIPTGAVLDVAATASADRRYVMMTIRPQVSNQEGDPLAVLTDGGIIQLPTVSVQDLQTTVTVPDGGTLLLGGQKLSGESEREMGAPVLSKIPIISRLFNNRATVRDERTLLVLVKPKIMINEQAERNERLYVEPPRDP